MPESFLVVSLLLLAHHRVERQFLISLVDASHCVVVVKNCGRFLNLLLPSTLDTEQAALSKCDLQSWVSGKRKT